MKRHVHPVLPVTIAWCVRMQRRMLEIDRSIAELAEVTRIPANVIDDVLEARVRESDRVFPIQVALGVNEAGPGRRRKVPSTYRELSIAMSKLRQYERFKRDAICVQCKTKPATMGMMCEVCRAHLREYTVEWKQRMLAEDRCVRCGKPVDVLGAATCAPCSDVHAKSNRRLREQRKRLTA